MDLCVLDQLENPKEIVQLGRRGDVFVLLLWVVCLSFKFSQWLDIRQLQHTRESRQV